MTKVVMLLIDAACSGVLVWCFYALRWNGWRIESNTLRVNHNRRVLAELQRRLAKLA